MNSKLSNKELVIRYEALNKIINTVVADSSPDWLVDIEEWVNKDQKIGFYTSSFSGRKMSVYSPIRGVIKHLHSGESDDLFLKIQVPTDEDHRSDAESAALHEILKEVSDCRPKEVKWIRELIFWVTGVLPCFLGLINFGFGVKEFGLSLYGVLGSIFMGFITIGVWHYILLFIITIVMMIFNPFKVQEWIDRDNNVSELKRKKADYREVSVVPHIV